MKMKEQDTYPRTTPQNALKIQKQEVFIYLVESGFVGRASTLGCS